MSLKMLMRSVMIDGIIFVYRYDCVGSLFGQDCDISL